MPLNGLKNCWNEYPRQCAVPSTGVLLSRENRIHFLSCVYIEDITRWREDLNFMFEWQEQYLTSEQSERMRYCSCHENIKFISLSQCVMFFLLYGETNSTKAKGENRDVTERFDTHKTQRWHMENTPLGSRIKWRMESTSGQVPSKTLSSI